MFENLALLFADGSLLVLPAGTTLERARSEADEFDFGETESRTRIVGLQLEITTGVPKKNLPFRS